MLCILVNSYTHFGAASCLHLQGKKEDPPKCWQPFTSLHGVTPHDSNLPQHCKNFKYHTPSYEFSISTIIRCVLIKIANKILFGQSEHKKI